MSDDGAHLGMTAERGLEQALRGSMTPVEQYGMTPQQMRKYLSGAPIRVDVYDRVPQALGKIMLTYLEAHPEDLELPLSDVLDYPYYPDDPERCIREATLVQEGLYDKIKRVDPETGEQMGDMGITGFQAGWAFNAVRYALGLPPVSNPAIMTVDVTGADR